MNTEFEVHILNEVGIVRARLLAAIFDLALTNVLELIERDYGNGRYVALTRTHMELASFYAKKALAVLQENKEGK